MNREPKGDNIVLMVLLALIWVHLVLNTPTLADFNELKTEVEKCGI